MFKPLLIGLLFAITLHAFDELAITVAMPLIAEDLNGREYYGIAFVAYLLASLLTLVWAGNQTDETGPLRPFYIGMVFFCAGMVLAATAPNMIVFVVARALQGLGGGAFTAIVYASVNRGYPEAERPKIMAYLSFAWVIPSLAAPMLTGAIAEYWNWRLIFIVPLPLALATTILASKGLRELGPGEARGLEKEKGRDAIRIASGMTMIVGALSIPLAWYSALLVAAGVAIAWGPLVRVIPEGEGDHHRKLVASLTVRMLVIFGFFGADAFMPLLLMDVRGLTAFGAGLVLTVASITWVAGSFTHARLADRVSPNILAGVGSALTVVTMLGLIFVLNPAYPFWIVYYLWGLAGFGVGLTYNTLGTNAMAHTTKGREGATSTASGMSETLGLAIATGLGGAILNFGARTAWEIETSIAIIWLLCGISCVAAMFGAYFALDRDVPVAEEAAAE